MKICVTYDFVSYTVWGHLYSRVTSSQYDKICNLLGFFY